MDTFTLPTAAAATYPAAPTPLVVDRRLLNLLPAFGPRYTSYPTADRFTEAFPADAYESLLRTFDAPTTGVYVHVPFCRTVCYYCACNKVITANYAKAERYLDAIKREIDRVASLLPRKVPISDLHFGGGTPTYLKDEHLADLVRTIRDAFGWSDDFVGAIEIHPQTVSPDRLAFLHGLGFTRISLGIQDFDEAVQEAVNRHQSVEETAALMQKARELGMQSTNIDLIYGLPKQTPDGFARTLETVTELRPDRIALYRYAHLPSRFKPQRQIVDADLPTGSQSLDLMELAMARLSAAGYQFIGMDHFALPDDELAVAQREGRLRRDFQGYTARRPSDLISFGVSAIGKIGTCYVQNTRELPAYEEKVLGGTMAVTRGMRLDDDDARRADIIERLMCDFEFDIRRWERRFGRVFHDEFADELNKLGKLVDLGLVVVEPTSIRITASGRLMVRHVCQVFDAYLASAVMSKAQYSRNH